MREWHKWIDRFEVYGIPSCPIYTKQGENPSGHDAGIGASQASGGSTLRKLYLNAPFLALLDSLQVLMSQLIGLYSPPQTPNSNMEKGNLVNVQRPETPPPSDRRAHVPISPETPTHSAIHKEEKEDDKDGEVNMFYEDAHPSQPTTPILYNLIRNEAPPKFVIAPKTSETSEDKKDTMETEGEYFKRSIECRASGSEGRYTSWTSKRMSIRCEVSALTLCG